jgi:ectoine hydroxylase-related dioxygenase (phytanoyl-CoA dioxygenase family)
VLTQEQIDFFHANGYLIMRKMIRGAELEMLREQASVVQSQGVAKQGDRHLYKPGNNGEKVYWRSERMWSRGDIFQAVTVNPDILENIGQCVGEPFVPVNDSLVVKLAHEGVPVPWHQDPPYGFPEVIDTFPIPNFTTDIYLDHSGTDNGCVWAIPGRHLVGHVDFSTRSDEEMFARFGAVPVEMEPGDVLFHCISTPHGSRPNKSPLQRRIFYVHYMSVSTLADMRVKKKDESWGSIGPSLIPSMLEARRKFQWELPTDRATLDITDQEFRFTAQPVTPANHWAELIAGIPAETKARLKKI